MECYSVLAFCYNKYKKYVNKEDKMKTLTLELVKKVGRI